MNNILNANLFIVDDDPFTCLIYKKYLSNLGFQNLKHFLSGIDCLNNLEQKPEIVLLDHEMSQLNGFEILKKIKRHNPNTDVIMVSGQEDMNTAIESLKHGAFDYIIKDNSETSRIENTLRRLSKLKALRGKVSSSIFKKLFSNNVIETIDTF